MEPSENNLMSDRTLSRLALGLCVFAIIMNLAANIFGYLGRSAVLPPDFAKWPAGFIYLLSSTVFILGGGLVAVRQPRNICGWLLLFNGIGQGSILGFWESFGIYAFFVAPRPLPLASWAFLALPIGWMLWLITIPMLLLLYPSNKLPSSRWKPIIWLLVIAITITPILGLLSNSSAGWIAVTNPYALTGSAGQVVEAITVGVVLMIFLVLLASSISLIFRAWRSTGVERLQYKWFAYAASFLLLELFIDFFFELPQPWEALKETIPLILLPVAIGIAILRYRVWDIDVIIRRTLVYGALTLTLALVYFGSVILLQSVFTAVSGQGSAVAIVISTLVIAALFTPLRRRIQHDIDRRFYRKKYDAEKIVAAFGAGLREEVDLEELSARLLGVVEETLQPTSASLWVRTPKLQEKKS